MKKLSILFVLVATFAAATARAQTTEQLLADWQRAKTYTKAYLDAMTEDGYAFKPTPEMRSFAGQMLHLADGNYGLVCFATGKTNPIGKNLEKTTASPTKAIVTQAVMDSYDFVIATIQAMTPAQLQETIKQGNKEIPRVVMLGKAFEHQTHTRAQTVAYLRLKGVTPPQEMLF